SLLRNQFAVKKAKLEQMGKNVFGLEQTDDLAEQPIQAIEPFYPSIEVATQLTEHGEDKAAAIDNIIGKLEAHGMGALGENQAIPLKESREILEHAVA
ncbi:NADH-dependent alcohol dehydrogenase, partial [Pseudoalteromonas sp. S4741]